jgi:hypothetical protein
MQRSPRDLGDGTLVHRVISRRHTVGFKRVWKRGVSEERPAPFYTPAARSSLCQRKNVAGPNERTTTQTDPFQANPLGRGQLADFLSGGRRAVCLLLMT